VTHWDGQQASSAVHQRVTADSEKLVTEPVRHLLGRGRLNGGCVAHNPQPAGGRYGCYFVVQGCGHHRLLSGIQNENYMDRRVPSRIVSDPKTLGR
jgi:hypothetical protein